MNQKEKDKSITVIRKEISVIEGMINNVDKAKIIKNRVAIMNLLTREKAIKELKINNIKNG